MYNSKKKAMTIDISSGFFIFNIWCHTIFDITFLSLVIIAAVSNTLYLWSFTQFEKEEMEANSTVAKQKYDGLLSENASLNAIIECLKEQ